MIQRATALKRKRKIERWSKRVQRQNGNEGGFRRMQPLSIDNPRPHQCCYAITVATTTVATTPPAPSQASTSSRPSSPGFSLNQVKKHPLLFPSVISVLIKLVSTIYIWISWNLALIPNRTLKVYKIINPTTLVRLIILCILVSHYNLRSLKVFNARIK